MRVTQSIYAKLFLPFALSVVVAMLLAWWIAMTLLTSSLERRLDSQLQHTTETLAQGAFPFTPELLKRLAGTLDANIVLMDHDGRVALATMPRPEGELADILLTGPLRENQPPRMERFTIDRVTYRASVQALAAERDQRFAAVAAMASIEDITDASRRAALLLGLAMLFATALLAWIGHRLSVGITTPVKSLSSMAGRIAEGDRGVQAEVSRRDEIGTLIESLNKMTLRLAEYEEQIVRQNRLSALGEMSARVAHEIRNPLTAIKMHLQLLQESAGGKERKTVEVILGEMQRLEMVVESSLALGRDIRIDLAHGDLNVLVEEVAALVRPGLDHRHIELIKILEEIPFVALDADRMKQLLLNLINNAADELTDGGTIRVGTAEEAHGAAVILTVEDSGPGIPPERREDLFETPAGDKPFGLGIGLLLCREIAEQHGGRISVDGDTDLGGARFIVRLPAPIMA